MRDQTVESIFLCCLLVACCQCAIAQQTGARSLECSTVHAACSACSSVAAGSKVMCTACASPAYTVSRDQHTYADCAAGYYHYANSSSTAVCLPCAKGSFCLGGPAQAAGTHSCGPWLTTASTGAASAASCITLPGSAFMKGVGTAMPCPVGSLTTAGIRETAQPALSECPHQLLVLAPLAGARHCQAGCTRHVLVVS